MGKLTLHWDKLDLETKEEILAGACIPQKFAHFGWGEIEAWLQCLITNSLDTRSKGTVALSE